MDRRSLSQLYNPLINAMDRKTRAPLRAWCRTLVSDLKDFVVARNMGFQNIAPVLNQLALLEAYRGCNDNALQLCSAQIVFWKNISQSTNKERYLGFTVQPWINILRLDRWNNRMGSATALYRELSPENRVKPGEFNRRFDIENNVGELSQFSENDDMARTLDSIYWKEYGRLLLDSNCHDELQRHLNAGLSDSHNNSRAALLEILLVYQMRIGKYEAALAFLIQANVASTSSYWLHFKVMEMYLNVKLDKENADALVKEVCEALISDSHISHDAYGLNLLVDIIRIFNTIEMPDIEILLLQKARALAQALNDEFLSFQIMNQLCSLKQIQHSTVLEQFRYTSYSSIHRTLGLDNAASGDTDLSQRIMQAVNLLAALNFDACEELLNTENESALLV